MAKPKKQSASAINSVADFNRGVIGDININISSRPPVVVKEKYADGTIGRDAKRRNYVAYLLSQYYEFKKADVSFGVPEDEHARVMAGLYKVVNNTIRKNFGAYPNALPVDAFGDLVEFMQKRIDGTRLGRKQKKAGHQNYKSFEEHAALSAPDTP